MQTETVHSKGPYSAIHLIIPMFFVHCMGLKSNNGRPLAHEAEFDEHSVRVGRKNVSSH
jgi:hypothetical protein